MKLFLKGERCFTPKCSVDPTRRPFPPGQHGQRRRKQSEYGVQLQEKQKAKNIYGVLERQFRKHFDEAARRPGVTGENLLQILESRLDNVVYRMGFADSRKQARQLVTHGHFEVNGRKTNVPSFMVKPGMAISVRVGHRTNEYFKALQEDLGRRTTPPWVQLDSASLTGRVLSLPNRADIDANLQEQLIVEYYSR